MSYVHAYGNAVHSKCRKTMSEDIGVVAGEEEGFCPRMTFSCVQTITTPLFSIRSLTKTSGIACDPLKEGFRCWGRLRAPPRPTIPLTGIIFILDHLRLFLQNLPTNYTDNLSSGRVPDTPHHPLYCLDSNIRITLLRFTYPSIFIDSSLRCILYSRGPFRGHHSISSGRSR